MKRIAKGVDAHETVERESPKKKSCQFDRGSRTSFDNKSEKKKKNQKAIGSIDVTQ